MPAAALGAGGQVGSGEPPSNEATCAHARSDGCAGMAGFDVPRDTLKARKPEGAGKRWLWAA